MYIKRAKWTAKQTEFLRANWKTMSDEEISQVLGKTLKSVRRKRENMEMKKASGRGVVCEFGKYVKLEAREKQVAVPKLEDYSLLPKEDKNSAI